jgi:hypothetical protein
VVGASPSWGFGIGIPEEHGGIGGDAVDTFVVMEALGTGLVVEPYPHRRAGRRAGARCGQRHAKAAVLPVAGGEAARARALRAGISATS